MTRILCVLRSINQPALQRHGICHVEQALGQLQRGWVERPCCRHHFLCEPIPPSRTNRGVHLGSVGIQSCARTRIYQLYTMVAGTRTGAQHVHGRDEELGGGPPSRALGYCSALTLKTPSQDLPALGSGCASPPSRGDSVAAVTMRSLEAVHLLWLLYQPWQRLRRPQQHHSSGHPRERRLRAHQTDHNQELPFHHHPTAHTDVNSQSDRVWIEIV